MIVESFSGNNPVGKLFSLLTRLQHRNGSAKDVLTQALLPENHTSGDSVYHAIGLFLDLVERSGASLKASSLKEQLWKRHFNSLENTLRVGMNNLTLDWSVTSNKITPEIMTALEFCADHIAERQVTLKNIDETTLDSLEEALAELFREITESTIDDALKTLLLKNIESARRAIFQYRIYGNEKIEDQFKIILTDLYFNQAILESTKETHKGVYQKLWNLLLKYKDVLTMVNSSYQAIPLMTEAGKFLKAVIP